MKILVTGGAGFISPFYLYHFNVTESKFNPLTDVSRLGR